MASWSALHLTAGFFASRVLGHAWQADEDEKLLRLYEQHGPSWMVVCRPLKGRSPTDCRKRWLKLSGMLKDDNDKDGGGDGLDAKSRQLYLDGYEKQNGRWIRFPIEPEDKSPFRRIGETLPWTRFRAQRRREGWTEPEQMVLREGYEEFGRQGVYGWNRIARHVPRRTSTQCRNFMARKYMRTNRLCRADLADTVVLSPQLAVKDEASAESPRCREGSSK